VDGRGVKLACDAEAQRGHSRQNWHDLHIAEYKCISEVDMHQGPHLRADSQPGKRF
jgi:hypothetical protein